MERNMELIPVQNLLFMLLPLAVVGYCYYNWVDDAKEIIYATSRMAMIVWSSGISVVIYLKMISRLKSIVRN